MRRVKLLSEASIKWSTIMAKTMIMVKDKKEWKSACTEKFRLPVCPPLGWLVGRLVDTNNNLPPPNNRRKRSWSFPYGSLSLPFLSLGSEHPCWWRVTHTHQAATKLSERNRQQGERQHTHTKFACGSRIALRCTIDIFAVVVVVVIVEMIVNNW